jgi:hypothetical protein
MAVGSRLVKRSPTSPTRNLESRCVEGWYSSSGVVPRAFAITFVLPKKSLSKQIKTIPVYYSPRFEYAPAITQLVAHILQISIPHVVYGEDEAVLVLIQTFSDIGEDFNG